MVSGGQRPEPCRLKGNLYFTCQGDWNDLKQGSSVFEIIALKGGTGCLRKVY